MTRFTTALAITVLVASVSAQQQRPDSLGPQQGPQQGPQPTQIQYRDARNFRKLRMSGEEVAANVKRLTKELRWHKSVNSVLAAARAKGRPALWIQALGDIDGYL